MWAECTDQVVHVPLTVFGQAWMQPLCSRHTRRFGHQVPEVDEPGTRPEGRRGKVAESGCGGRGSPEARSARVCVRAGNLSPVGRSES